MIEQQLPVLAAEREREGAPPPEYTALPNGSHLIRVPQVNLGPGWDRAVADVLFVAPPGYPSAPPDCFWVEPGGLRLEGGRTPANTNDSNPIPGDVLQGRNTTWFSWHLQGWNPNGDRGLLTFFNVIQRRLQPAR